MKSAQLGRPDKDSIACKSRGREATMGRLMDAGVKIFSEYGYDAATTKLVAKEAGINESLINRYFDGKPGLLLAILQSFLDGERNNGVFSKYPPGETLEQEINHFFHATLEHHLRVSSFLKVVVSRAIVDPRVGEKIQKNVRQGVASVLLDRLRGFQSRGAIRAEVELDKVSFTITQVSFSMGFLGHIVLGYERDFVVGALVAFARDFACGLGPIV